MSGRIFWQVEKTWCQDTRQRQKAWLCSAHVLCAVSSSPTCVDATQQYRGKPTESKDCGIMEFGFCLGFFWWVFFSKVSERRRAGELTQRKSSSGEEQEGGQGRTLSLCWFSYLTPVTLTNGFIT